VLSAHTTQALVTGGYPLSLTQNIFSWHLTYRAPLTHPGYATLAALSAASRKEGKSLFPYKIVIMYHSGFTGHKSNGGVLSAIIYEGNPLHRRILQKALQAGQ